MPTQPLAYFISFRCYGTWLHGDARGSVDRRHNLVGEPLLAPHPARERWEAGRMSHGAVGLQPAERSLVEPAIREVCVHRGWDLHAVNVRTNHVHLVVAADLSPERVLNTLKAWSTRRLRETGARAPGAPVWSRHGSTRYLWHLDAVEAACQYVNEAQDAAAAWEE